ncbi:MAG: hypothetical protein QG635_1267, partial [Bacteroidota bacterium]|nr:hypothetical protein [Bacteroidota bacterium]
PRLLKKNSNQFINKFNLFATGWINAKKQGSLSLNNLSATPSTGPLSAKFAPPIGTQGRYYLSAVNGTDTLDFVNTINLAGVRYIFDYPYNSTIISKIFQVTLTRDPMTITEDFKPGDKVNLKTTGGALGMPLPGAKVLFTLNDPTPKNMNDYTDDILNQITVVPNPYLISHEGQSSPYDGRIYFTKLPKECTIDIFTVTGDLVKTIQHNEFNSSAPDQASTEIWDVLTKNDQRVQSQTLVALIKTPNGAKTVKQFSVVVGGFRLIQE